MTLEPVYAGGDDLTGMHGVIRVSRLPIHVRVQFADQSGTCDTLEGPVRYRRGDALIEGVDGERWPVERKRFERSYVPVPPSATFCDGVYMKVPSSVLAVRLELPAKVCLSGDRGLLQGRPGDWLVQYAPGDFGIVAASIFDRTYELPRD